MNDIGMKLDFFWNVHSHNAQLIRFLDRKARFGSAGAAAVLAFCLTLFKGTVPIALTSSYGRQILGVAIFLSMASLLFLTLVIVPRRAIKHNTKGLIFWRQIEQYDNPEDWVNAALNSDADTCLIYLLRDLHHITKIVATKTRLLTYALWLLGVAIMTLGTSILVG